MRGESPEREGEGVLRLAPQTESESDEGRHDGRRQYAEKRGGEIEASLGKSRNSRRSEGQDRCKPRASEDESQDAADESHESGLGEKSAGEAGSSRSKGGPYRELALPRGIAGKEQAGNVDACDEEQQNDGSLQNQDDSRRARAEEELENRHHFDPAAREQVSSLSLLEFARRQSPFPRERPRG